MLDPRFHTTSPYFVMPVTFNDTSTFRRLPSLLRGSLTTRTPDTGLRDDRVSPQLGLVTNVEGVIDEPQKLRSLPQIAGSLAP